MDNKIQDDSSDRKYFIITPQIVWAQCRDPYDFTLWNVVKMVTAEKGECFLSTEDLAYLSMMSMGKVSECRKYLISVGLLAGELRKDPDYPQPVWHLRIPDLWPKNVEWRQKFDSLKQRVAYKANEKVLHLMKPSPGEGGISPSEGGTSPGETKKNQKNNQKKNPAPISKKIDPVRHMVGFLASPPSDTTGPNPDDQWLNNHRDKALAAFKGNWGSSPEERQTKKNLILGFVADTENFNPDHWAFVIEDCIAHGVSANNIARFIEVYQHQNYDAYLAHTYHKDQQNGKNGITTGPTIKSNDGGIYV